MHFNEDAPQTPHVNGHVILTTEQHLRRPIEPTLNVLVDLSVTAQFSQFRQGWHGSFTQWVKPVG